MPYIGNQPGTGVRSRFIYTATASQTTFSGADDNGKTLKYADSDFVDVFLNGVCLVPVTDYTSTSKTSIVLVQAASLNDTLEVVAYDIATIADTVSKADGGTFEDGVTIRTADNTTQLTLQSTDADADLGPILDLFRDGGSPADSDFIGQVRFQAKDDGGNVHQYAKILGQISDVTGGTEDGTLGIRTILAGTDTRRIDLTPTETVINEDSKDLDFRVESDGNANMLFVDGENDIVGIGRTPANSTVLDVEGDSSSTLRGLSIRNGNTGSGAAVSLIFSLNRTGSDVDFTAASITAHKVSSWTTTAATVDSYMTFSTINNETTAEKMRLDKDGNLLIGTTDSIVYAEGASGNSGLVLVGGSGYYSAARKNAPTAFLNRQASDGNIVEFYRDGVLKGDISISSSAVAYNSSSDYRLKENVTDISDGITRLKQLAPKRFNFIGEPDKTVDGFLAHEAQTVIPEAITGTKDGVEVWKEHEELPEGVSVGDNKLDDDGNTIPVYQGIDQSKLVPLLTAALQEAIAKIETLETKVAALEAE